MLFFFIHLFIYFCLLHFRLRFSKDWEARPFLSVSSSFLLHVGFLIRKPMGWFAANLPLPFWAHSPSSVCTRCWLEMTEETGDTGTRRRLEEKPLCSHSETGGFLPPLGGSSSCCSLLSVTHSGNFPLNALEAQGCEAAASTRATLSTPHTFYPWSTVGRAWLGGCWLPALGSHHPGL